MNQALQPYPNRLMGKDVNTNPPKLKMQDKLPQKPKTLLRDPESHQNVVYLPKNNGHAIERPPRLYINQSIDDAARSESTRHYFLY